MAESTGTIRSVDAYQSAVTAPNPETVICRAVSSSCGAHSQLPESGGSGGLQKRVAPIEAAQTLGTSGQKGPR